MRSIADDEKNLVENRSTHLIVGPGDQEDGAGGTVDPPSTEPNAEERTVLAAASTEIRQAMKTIFKDDPVACDLVEGIIEDLSADELRELTGLDKVAYASKRRVCRARRRHAKNAAEMRALFQKAILLANKKRLRAARAGVAQSAERRNGSAPVDMAEARRRLRGILERARDENLTLAARKESELSDADVLGILQDYDDLQAEKRKEEEDGGR